MVFEGFAFTSVEHIQYYPVLADMLASTQPARETPMKVINRSKNASESGVMLIEAAVAIVFLLSLMLAMSQYYILVSERHQIQKALLPALRILMNSTPNFCFPLSRDQYLTLSAAKKTEFVNLVHQRLTDSLIESQAIADIALNNGQVFNDPDQLNSSSAYTNFFLRAALASQASNYNFVMAIGRITKSGNSSFISSYLENLANFSMIQAPITQQSSWCIQALQDLGGAQEIFSDANLIEQEVRDATKNKEES